MANMARWMEDQVEALGSVQAAYDKFYGTGSYGSLMTNAANGDTGSIEELQFLYDCWGEINNETLTVVYL